MVNYTLKVIDIRKETADTLTLCFKQPTLRKVKYQAGQYISLIFRINGRRYIRPYSFSSTPDIDPHIEVSVKRVPNGIVSNHIHDKVLIGDSIEVIEPMGDFTYKAESHIKEIYFWGAGSGITPLISLLKYVLTFTDLKATLVYGNKNSDTTIFLETIGWLKNKYKDRLRVWHFHTQLELSQNNPDVVEGRINKDYACDILDGVDANITSHYICGPVGLKQSVSVTLLSLGTPKHCIFTEDFEIIRDPKDFEGIVTRNVELHFQSLKYDLEVTKGKSILEAALDAGLELPYSCQTGTCSTCKAKCLTGDVKMIGLSDERADLSTNEFLLCCSHPVSDNVCVEI